MKSTELVSHCRCQHLRLVHNGFLGHCQTCLCGRYRRDDDRYPLGQMVVSG